ncbi:MAG: GlsB/YeaQ/YmgE family stress response membrane protein [Verrucomicrobiota bacterium]
MTGIIWTVVIGLLIGVVAKLLMPGRDPGGCIITILIGIAGSFVASYLGQALGWYQPGQPAGFIGSVIGAMLLLLLYRLIFGRRT